MYNIYLTGKSLQPQKSILKYILSIIYIMWKNNFDIKYIDTTNENQINQYANSIMNNNNILNSSLYEDVKLVLNGGCQYYQEYLCKRNDMTYFYKLEEELKTKNITSWSKHHKYENPDGLTTFDEIVKQLCEKFNIKPLHTRLNYYFPNDWKPFHHDSHAYHDNDKEDITIGASFGASRKLEFIHDESKCKFNFPQRNGDVFAFNNDVNKKFMHGVPKELKCDGNRISIIVWGKKN
jgi:hypothetical protein